MTNVLSQTLARRTRITSSQVGLTKIAEWDFEALAVGTYTSMADSSGNAKTLSPVGQADFAIINDGNRRGVQANSLLTLRNTDKAYWKKLHDGTQDYTIVIEGRVDNPSNSEIVAGLLGTTNASSASGFAVSWDARKTTSYDRNNAFLFSISRAVAGQLLIDGRAPHASKGNKAFTLTVNYRASRSSDHLAMYSDRSQRLVQSRNALSYSAVNPTNDLEVLGAGNAAGRFNGVIYRVIIYSGYLNASFRTLLESSRPNPVDFYPIRQRVQTAVANGRYNAFGAWFYHPDMGSKAFHIYRSGTSHANNLSRLDLVEYDIITGTISSPVTIYSDASLDCREARGGVINGQIYVFFARRNSAGSPVLTQGMGYIKSTDLTATSWSAYNSLPFECTNASMFGKLLKGLTPGTYYLPFWDANLWTADKYIVGYYKTTDYGTSWSRVKIYEGTLKLNEHSMEILPDGRMISIIRIELFASSGLYQCTSTDGGNTWSAPAKINVGGATERNVPELYYQASENRLVLLFQNRSNGYLEVSFGDPTAVFASATAWQASVLYYFNNPSGSTSFPGLGYASIMDNAIAKELFLLMWAQEPSDGVSNLMLREENFKAIYP